jgi:thiol-disulfide isomerase/thioredoxin
MRFVARGALLLAFAAAALVAAQELSDKEQEDLRTALSEGSSSAVDLIRALETHLAKYPDSPKKADLIRALAKAAVQAKDQKRVAKYGEQALARDPGDIQMLDAVCRSAVMDPEKAKAALEWAKHMESAVREAAKDDATAHVADRVRRRDEVERLLGRSLLYQAVATGTMGNHEAAVALARKSFETFPAGETAAALAKELAALGKNAEAVAAYADAFTVADPQATEADRAAVRRHMGELYQRWKGAEAGLGDIVLQAYDRNAALIAERRMKLKQFDPNLGLTNPMEFTLSAFDGQKLPLASLAGKVVVMDFWATWCGPCRAQHPLYDKVKSRFKKRNDVVFLSINTDEDRSAVEPFLSELGWSKKVYFEDGLSRTLRVSSIPATLVFGKDGAVVSRMNGYDPERFVDMLSERIEEALKGRS